MEVENIRKNDMDWNRSYAKLFQNQDIGLFTRYIICAGFATFVDLGLLYSLSEFGHIWYIYSAIISYTIAMIINYLLNKYLSFKNRSKKIISQFGLYTLVSMIGLAFNQIILYSLVELLRIWYMYAKIVTIFIIMFWNFYGHKKLTFNIFK